MMLDQPTPQFKIVLIGDSGVGKTCLVRQFTQRSFPTKNGATIGVDFLIKQVKVDDTTVNLQLWDTAGQERFRAITQAYYRSAQCLILVYDISNGATFKTLPQWCRDMEQYTGGSNEVYRVLVGNKCDKDREIEYDTGEKFALDNQFDLFFETSALHSDNVDQLFTQIAQTLTFRKCLQSNSHSDSLSLSSNKSFNFETRNSASSGCCSG